MAKLPSALVLLCLLTYSSANARDYPILRMDPSILRNVTDDAICGTLACSGQLTNDMRLEMLRRYPGNGLGKCQGIKYACTSSDVEMRAGSPMAGPSPIPPKDSATSPRASSTPSGVTTIPTTNTPTATPQTVQQLPGPAAGGWFVVMGRVSNGGCAALVSTNASYQPPQDVFVVTKRFGPYPSSGHATGALKQSGWNPVFDPALMHRNIASEIWVANTGC